MMLKTNVSLVSDAMSQEGLAFIFEASHVSCRSLWKVTMAPSFSSLLRDHGIRVPFFLSSFGNDVCHVITVGVADQNVNPVHLCIQSESPS